MTDMTGLRTCAKTLCPIPSHRKGFQKKGCARANCIAAMRRIGGAVLECPQDGLERFAFGSQCSGSPTGERVFAQCTASALGSFFRGPVRDFAVSRKTAGLREARC